ncbi:MAG: Nif3-like dinuclear metal center hexameric protein [Solirubrobacteraceae bacterium]
MPAPLEEIVAAMDQLLQVGEWEDYCPNGLQVQGRSQVKRIVSGVSAHLELFERAAELDAELIVVHHGIFWRGDSPRVVGPLRARLALLLDAGISLAAYHLPLDAHPQLGNNALLARALGCEAREPWQRYGCAARLAGTGIAPQELQRRVAALIGREPLMFDAGPSRVRRLAIVSGAGSGCLDAAIDDGFDAFLTGEPTERVMAQAREAGIHFLAAGHHATETLGVQALAQHVAERFDIEHLWVDVPNPI